MIVVELLRNVGADPQWGNGSDDDRRPLDRDGTAVADALAAALGGDPPVARVVSSPALRCRQTVEPLARAFGLDVESDERLAEIAAAPVGDDGEAWVDAAWRGGRALRVIDEVLTGAAQGDRVVLCSHGAVVPAVMALLAGRDALAVAEVRCRRGGRFTLGFEGRRCVSVAAAPPPQAPSG